MERSAVVSPLTRHCHPPSFPLEYAAPARLGAKDVPPLPLANQKTGTQQEQSCIGYRSLFYSDTVSQPSVKAERLLDSFYFLFGSLGASLVATGTVHLVLHFDIEFYLRFSSGRTHAHLCIVVAEPLQHIA